MPTEPSESRVRLRPAHREHAEALAELLTRNREHFATGEPARPSDFYTAAFQREVIARARQARDEGSGFLWLIEDDGELVGRFNLTSVIRGALQSASVGYLVDQRVNGRGIATAALREAIDFAFGELDLHRLQAETLTDNRASQAVLRKCGFVAYGMAPEYLKIGGRWRDHDLFQLINPDH